jgi:hypothetical protein
VDSSSDRQMSKGEAVSSSFGPKGNRDEAIVKSEELAIVVIVLVLWVAAIALFINREDEKCHSNKF